MADEVLQHRRLDSEMFGSLVHATEVVASLIRPQLAAACILDGPPAAETCYVSPARLQATRAQEETLADWPQDPSSLFRYVHQKNLRDDLFRPREVVSEVEFARLRLYRAVEAVATVRDVICLTVDLSEKAWCCLALLRCGDHPPFPPDALAAIERLRPTLGRTLKRGYDREVKPRGYELKPDGNQLVPRPLTGSEMLAKLSRTEMQVLGYLRSDMTERGIASKIHRSPHTVHVHVKNIYRKLSVSSRKDLLELFQD